MSEFGKFLTPALAVILAGIAQIKLKPLLGWAPDLVLVALIAASFRLRLPQFLALVLLGAWFLNWRPGADQNILFYAALPLAAFFLRRFLPWRPWFASLVLGVAGIAVFYLVTAGYGALAAGAGIFWENVFWSSLFGLGAFKILEYASEEERVVF
jgi:hypothetical protein